MALRSEQSEASLSRRLESGRLPACGEPLWARSLRERGEVMGWHHLRVRSFSHARVQEVLGAKSSCLLLNLVVLRQVVRVVTLHDGSSDVLPKDFAKARQEVLGSHCAILVGVLGVSEGRVEVELDKASELFLS